MLVKEGLVNLEIPKEHLEKKHFFNPEMEFDRDLMVLVINTLKTKDWVVCDVLSGVGARGIRIAKECDVKEVWLNDVSEDVFPFLERNVKINRVKGKTRIFNKDANELLSENERTFDYIDIDPFGSPSFYFDSCARSIKKKGLLAFTATDTAPLAGTNPMTCLRRYGTKSYKTDFFKELGLRILISSITLSLSRWSLSFKPLLSYARRHYFRVFGEVEKGKVKTNQSLKKNLSYVNYCPRCLWREISEPMEKCGFCGSECEIIGRVWVSGVEDVNFIKKCQKNLSSLGWLGTRRKIEKLLNLLEKESLPFYYDLHKVCKKHRLRIPKFKSLQEELRERGYEAERTHFSNKGIKTDANLKDLIMMISGKDKPLIF